MAEWAVFPSKRTEDDFDEWRQEQGVAHVVEVRRIRQSVEERSEVLDPLHTVMLGLWRKLAARNWHGSRRLRTGEVKPRP